MATEVVNVKVKYIRPAYHNLADWTDDPANTYIGRRGIVFINGKRFPEQDSPFANPYKIGKGNTREDVLAQYKVYIERKIANKEVDLEQLRGQKLGCWCKPDPCHCDILIELLEK